MKRTSRIKAVCFDVGGTLIEPWPSVGHVYASVAAEAGLPPHVPDELSTRFMTAWKLKAGFDYSREAWGKIVVATFGGAPEAFDSKSPFFERLYARFAQASAWRVHDDVRPTLEILKRNRFRLAVISNWDDRLRPLLCRLELDDFFDCIQVSAELGVHKPAPEIFLRTTAALGVTPGEALHVGDSEDEDALGAAAAGLTAVLISRSTSVDRKTGREFCEIASLAEVVDLVKGSGKGAP